MSGNAPARPRSGLNPHSRPKSPLVELRGRRHPNDGCDAGDYKVASLGELKRNLRNSKIEQLEEKNMTSKGTF